MKKYLLFFSLILFCAVPLPAKKVIIKMATLAPEGTEWHGMLVDLGQQWEEATNGQVKMRIYPNGVVGDERDMIRKMRIGQIHAAAITSEGLSELNPDVNVFITPLIFDDYDDVDYIRSQIGDDLKAGIYQNGFKLMYWADVGWAYWFATKPIIVPDDLRSMKIFTWAGDFKAAELWEKGGYNSVPLASIDVLSGLQTGLINAMGTNPLVALSMQWFGIANHMSDVKWGLLTAGFVIDNRTWNKISPEHQTAMMEIAEKVGKEHQKYNRYKDQEAIDAMKQYGLKVHTLTDSQKTEWKKLLRIWYPDIRGNYIPEEIFDEVVQLMDERNKTK